jgi:hypothetical protein
MTLDEMVGVVDKCHYPNYTLSVKQDTRGSVYLQATYWEPDTRTGENALQFTRRWLLSPEMTASEIVQTVFKCVLTSAEHRVREWFKYRNQPIFGPHFNVDVLAQVCGTDCFDERLAQ